MNLVHGLCTCRADREEMMARAAPMQQTPTQPTTVSMTGKLIRNEVQDIPFAAPR